MMSGIQSKERNEAKKKSQLIDPEMVCVTIVCCPRVLVEQVQQILFLLRKALRAPEFAFREEMLVVGVTQLLQKRRLPLRPYFGIVGEKFVEKCRRVLGL